MGIKTPDFALKNFKTGDMVVSGCRDGLGGARVRTKLVKLSHDCGGWGRGEEDGTHVRKIERRGGHSWVWAVRELGCNLDKGDPVYQLATGW